MERSATDAKLWADAAELSLQTNLKGAGTDPGRSTWLTPY
jgi:hypothetical protein